MKTKVLLFNSETGDIKVSQAVQSGIIFQSFLRNGYRAIAKIKSFSSGNGLPERLSTEEAKNLNTII